MPSTNTQAAPDPTPGKQSPFRRAFTVWWLLLALLLTWNLTGPLFRSSGPSVVTLPYSVLVDQVQHDNVDVVRIGGTLVKPVRWPPNQATPAKPTAGKSPAA